MERDQELLGCFWMPKGVTITGRSSSIRNAFVAAIVPKTFPTADQVAHVLDILDMEPTDLRCSYCGALASEWDHLRPLVTDGKPTGYPSSIRNLVPSCGKCNQSKGKSDWKTWMTGGAKYSPASRGVDDLDARARRLEAYEAWADCRPLKIEEVVDKELWHKYNELQSDILDIMIQAQDLARELARQVRERARDT